MQKAFRNYRTQCQFNNELSNWKARAEIDKTLYEIFYGCVIDIKDRNIIGLSWSNFGDRAGERRWGGVGVSVSGFQLVALLVFGTAD